MSYTVFATIPVKPEHLEDAAQAVAAILPASRGEPGCITFEPRLMADGSCTIMIFEEWADRDAFDFHHAQDYTKDVYAKYENWLEAEPVLVEAKSLEG